MGRKPLVGWCLNGHKITKRKNPQVGALLKRENYRMGKKEVVQKP